MARTIAREFDTGAWINPYKNPLGLGNYDASVLVKVLDARGTADAVGGAAPPCAGGRRPRRLTLLVSVSHRADYGVGESWYARVGHTVGWVCWADCESSVPQVPGYHQGAALVCPAAGASGRGSGLGAMPCTSTPAHAHCGYTCARMSCCSLKRQAERAFGTWTASLLPQPCVCVVCGLGFLPATTVESISPTVPDPFHRPSTARMPLGHCSLRFSTQTGQ